MDERINCFIQRFTVSNRGKKKYFSITEKCELDEKYCSCLSKLSMAEIRLFAEIALSEYKECLSEDVDDENPSDDPLELCQSLIIDTKEKLLYQINLVINQVEEISMHKSDEEKIVFGLNKLTPDELDFIADYALNTFVFEDFLREGLFSEKEQQ